MGEEVVELGLFVVEIVGAPGHQVGFFVGHVVGTPGFFELVVEGFEVDNEINPGYGGWVGKGGIV